MQLLIEYLSLEHEAFDLSMKFQSPDRDEIDPRLPVVLDDDSLAIVDHLLSH